jgi:hypothetical protein
MSEDTDLMSIFDQFQEIFKIDEESKLYADLREVPIMFNSEMLKLEDPHNFQLLLEETNNISSLIFRYKMVLAMQLKVVQTVDDEYSLWYAQQWTTLDANAVEPKFDRSGVLTGHKKIAMTGTAIDQHIIANNPLEYTKFRNMVKDEQYKLTIIKAAVGSLENYSFKLQEIFKYKQLTESRNI